MALLPCSELDLPSHPFQRSRLGAPQAPRRALSPPQAAVRRAPAPPRCWGQRESAALPTSSSQYLRITSRALSVISGASSTTLVKILPEGGTRSGCREAAWPPGSVNHRAQRPRSTQPTQSSEGNEEGSNAASWVTWEETSPL